MTITYPVLKPVSLINDAAAPLDFFQLKAVRDDNFKCGDEHIEFEDIGNAVPFVVLIVHLIFQDHVAAGLSEGRQVKYEGRHKTTKVK